MMNLHLEGLKVAIAGGTRGIGLAIGHMFARENCQLAICGQDSLTMSVALSELKRHGNKIRGDTLDISDTEKCRDWVKSAAEDLGGLDVFIGNAAALSEANNDPGWRRSVDVGLLGVIAGADAAIAFLRNSTRPTIIFVASTAGIESGGQALPYSAVKAALIAHAKDLAIELSNTGIRVNAISPGMVYDKSGCWGQMEQTNPDYFNYVKNSNPMRRMADLNDVTNAVAFLTSTEGSFINGTNLVIDGGRSRSYSG